MWLGSHWTRISSEIWSQASPYPSCLQFAGLVGTETRTVASPSGGLVGLRCFRTRQRLPAIEDVANDRARRRRWRCECVIETAITQTSNLTRPKVDGMSGWENAPDGRRQAPRAAIRRRSELRKTPSKGKAGDEVEDNEHRLRAAQFSTAGMVRVRPEDAAKNSAHGEEVDVGEVVLSAWQPSGK